MDLEKAPQTMLEELRNATEDMRKYSEEVAPLAPIADALLRDQINVEIKQGSIVVDANGLPDGARIVFDHVRSYLLGCRDRERSFNDRFQPFEQMKREFDSLPGKIAELESKRDSKIAEVRLAFEGHRDVVDYLEKKQRHDYDRANHASEPNLNAKSSWFPFDINPLYLALLLCVGAAEWFINYDTVFLFFGVPAIAYGSTIVIAVVFAFIAHQYGMDIKQWKKRFGPAVPRKQRPYGFFILITCVLLTAFTIVGWMRYQSLVDVMRSQSTANIIGTQYQVRIDLQREIIISLGANFLAWFAGVLVSYFAHDADEEYAKRAIDYRKSERKFRRREAEFDETVDQIKQQCEENVEKLRNRQQKFEANMFLREALSLREQVQQYALGFRDRAKAFMIGQCGRYRSELMRALVSHKDVHLVRREKNGENVNMPATEFFSMPFGIADDLLGLVSEAESRAA